MEYKYHQRLNEIRDSLENILEKVKVEVEKIQPPIDAAFDKISVTTEGAN